MNMGLINAKYMLSLLFSVPVKIKCSVLWRPYTLRVPILDTIPHWERDRTYRKKSYHIREQLMRQLVRGAHEYDWRRVDDSIESSYDMMFSVSCSLLPSLEWFRWNVASTWWSLGSDGSWLVPIFSWLVISSNGLHRRQVHYVKLCQTHRSNIRVLSLLRVFISRCILSVRMSVVYCCTLSMCVSVGILLCEW